MSGYTANIYKQPQETINGQTYPRGWLAANFRDSWMPAVEQLPFSRKIVPTSTQAISVSEQQPLSIVPRGSNGNLFFDFGKEIQATLIIQAQVPPELSGQKVTIQLAESLRAQGELQFPAFTGNRFAATFILGSGNISLETHEYVEFRYGTASFDDSSIAKKVQFKLHASVLHYPWVETDSDFTSSSDVLSGVYNLCRYTLKATSLDTYTDSNTRERLPYELDGFIAAKSRLLLQRELTWARHSFLYNIAYPTWPTEWHQLTVKMAHLDWLTTGQAVIPSKRQPALIQNTYARFQSKTTGLITKPNSSFPSTDIVDWPQNSRDGFVFTGINTVVNSYAAQTTAMLGQLGLPMQDTTSRSIVNAMDVYLFDRERGRYCDGLCSETNHTSLHANIFPLAFNLVPSERVGSVVRWVRERGMACSVYGAFPLLEAEFGVTAVGRNTTSDTPDYIDFGKAATALLTSCDTGLESAVGYGSWCGMMRQNATCTMEAWNPRQKPNLSFSHPGATAALIAIVEVRPGYSLFTLCPLGHLCVVTVHLAPRSPT